MKHFRLLSMIMPVLLLISVLCLLLCQCASSKDVNKSGGSGNLDISTVVNSSDTGKEVLIHGEIGEKIMKMKDATFWDEYWTLQNGLVLKDIDPSWETANMKKGLKVDVKGKLISVPGHMGVEDLKQYPGFTAFQVKEIRICKDRSHKNTVFNISQGPEIDNTGIKKK